MSMIKVITAQAMGALEKRAYQAGYVEQDFMEQAGAGIAHVIQDFIHCHQLFPKILLLCGKGNNAGDAFTAGYHLLLQGYSVSAVQLDPLEQCSPLCQLQGRRFIHCGGKRLESVDIDSYDLLIDGIFGTGFRGEVQEPYLSLIETANRSQLPILAIDIPSGLNGTTGEISSSTIRATETIYLGLPKTGFFLGQGWNVIGRLRSVDFGLPAKFIEEAQADFLLMTPMQAHDWLPPIQRNRHKYQAGYTIGLAGSPGMPGAALLASLAALRGGSGMVRLLHPEGMQEELSASPYELIKVPYENDQEVLSLMQKATATFVGPGLGRTERVANLLKSVLPLLEKPCVIDADALTLLAERNFTLPKQTILTPHTGEMQRLLHRENPLVLNQDLLKTCQAYVEEKQVTLVLKGAPTFIFHPGVPASVNPTGDPGMATAGSGDVLTGLLASLLAQKLSCHQAALFGAYLHGLAGEEAAKRKSSYCVIASDLIEFFPETYSVILKRPRSTPGGLRTKKSSGY